MKRLSVFLLLVLVTWGNSALAQLRSDLLYCGSTSRSGAALFSGVGPFTEVNSCTPDSNTQAMLVSRSGVGSLAGNGAALLNYLNNGGVIITEFSGTDNVYNEIFGTGYAQGPQSGGCRDNAMPEVIVNPSDAFWQANPIPVTPSGVAGCGMDLAALVAGEPQVTELGRRGNGTTSFAYRAVGTGVFFLLEADWQDSDSGYTSDSQTFMGALIRGDDVGAAPPSGPEEVPTLSQWALLMLAGLMAVVGFTAVRRRAIV